MEVYASIFGKVNEQMFLLPSRLWDIPILL